MFATHRRGRRQILPSTGPPQGPLTSDRNLSAPDRRQALGTEGALLEVLPRPETWPEIHKAWEAFAQCLAADTPPPLSTRDSRVRTDEAWRQAAESYAAAKAAADQAGTALNEAKARLTTLASHPKEEGAGVRSHSSGSKELSTTSAFPSSQG